MLFYSVASHLMFQNIISNDVENDWLKKNDVRKNGDNWTIVELKLSK